MEKSVVRLLISLDSLLDTRAGTLSLLDLKKTAMLLRSPGYASRILDHFPDFDMEAFKDRYAKRDRTTLQNSMMTNAIKIVYDFVHRATNRNLNTPFNIEPEVHLNIYPYKLTEKESQLFVKAITLKSPLPFQVNIVNYSNEDLTPGFIKQNYNTIVGYDFLEWIEIHSESEAIKHTPIPEVTYFAPALIRKTDDQLPKDLQEKFINAMMIFQLHLNLIYLPVDNFCSVIANKPTTNAPKDTGRKTVDEGLKEEEIPLTGDDLFNSWT